MKSEDKNEFARILRSACEVHNREYTQDLAGIWWNLLSGYAMSEFSQAMVQHLRREKFFPKPAEIVGFIEGRWMGADEAWALFPKSEDDTAAINQAMAVAWDAASDLYHGGDTIGARMAFKAAYDRHVSSAVGRGEREAWSISLGWDGDKREPVIRAALESKLITNQNALKLLQSVPARDGGPIAGLLTGKTQGAEINDEGIKERLQELKAMLG